MSRIKLRLALWKDEDFLRKIRNDNRRFFLNNKFIDKSDHHAWFRHKFYSDAIYIICFRNRRVGTVTLIKKGNVAELGRFIIEKSFRNRGLGHQAINEFKSICRSLAIRRIVLETRKDNKNALSLYAKEGFRMSKEDGEKVSMEMSLS